MDYFKSQGLPPIKEIISIGENILFNEWYYENKKYEYNERVEIMEKYEFIISHLILAISFLKIDQELLDKVNNIYDKTRYYNDRYFRNYPHNDPLMKIISFYVFKNRLKENNRDNNIFFDCGVYSGIENTKLFYKNWNEFYEYIFGKSKDYLTIDEILIKLKKKDTEKPENFEALIQHIKIPKTDFKEVIDLLSRFDSIMGREENTKKIYISGKTPKTVNRDIDFRSELFKKHEKLKWLFDALKKITNDEYECYIEDNENKKIFKWNGTKVLLAVLIMTYLETQTDATDFWRPFDFALDSKFRDSAKQYLNNLSSDKPDKNLKKANEILEKVKKLKIEKHLIIAI
jgi:hypothetical protein